MAVGAKKSQTKKRNTSVGVRARQSSVHQLPAALTPALLRQLELFQLQARRSMLGARQGSHTSLKRGHGIEFSDYRKYELGDNPRHIDWGVYARSDRLYVKRSQEEEDLTVLLLLDGSASMAVPNEKWLRACDIALGLGYTALMARDRVACSVLGGEHGSRFSGAVAYQHLLTLLRRAQPNGNPDMARELRQALSRVHFPGVALWISDFLQPVDEVRRLAQALRAKNFDTTAIQLIGPSEELPVERGLAAQCVDSESGVLLDLFMSEESFAEYQALMAQHNRDIQGVLQDNAISFAQHEITADLGDFFFDHLASTGLLR